MPTNLRFVDRFVRLILAIILIFVGVAIFKNWFARLLAVVGGLWTLGEALAARCPLASQLGSRSTAEPLSERALYLLGVVGVQLMLAYEWWMAGWEKISGGKFVDGLSGTFAHFASQNPFGWYKNFLLGFASDHANLFAYAVEWSELLVGVVLAVAGVAYIFSGSGRLKRAAALCAALALFGAALMNANFYLAAGWTGPSASGMNVLMFWIELSLLWVWLLVVARPASAGTEK